MNTLFKKAGQLLIVACLSVTLLSASTIYRDGFDDRENEFYTQGRNFFDPFLAFGFSDYTIHSIDFFGDNVVISDGSTWKIRPNDTSIVSQWNDLMWTNDYFSPSPSKIYITTNNNWHINNKFRYCLVNRDTKEFVFCDMTKSTPYEEQCVRINYIEYNTGRLELIDRNGITVCYLNSSDYNIFSKWKGGQLMMRGVNTGNNASSYPYILINVNTLTNARCYLSY